MSESFKMEALLNTGSNWPMYKAKTRAYAMSKGSLGILDGKTVNPMLRGKAEGSSEAVYQAAVLAYENKNNQLCFILHNLNHQRHGTIFVLPKKETVMGHGPCSWPSSSLNLEHHSSSSFSS